MYRSAIVSVAEVPSISKRSTCRSCCIKINTQELSVNVNVGTGAGHGELEVLRTLVLIPGVMEPLATLDTTTPFGSLSV